MPYFLFQDQLFKICIQASEIFVKLQSIIQIRCSLCYYLICVMEYNLKGIAVLCKLITVCISRNVDLKKKKYTYSIHFIIHH